jgi:hypothetical protein
MKSSTNRTSQRYGLKCGQSTTRTTQISVLAFISVSILCSVVSLLCFLVLAAGKSFRDAAQIATDTSSQAAYHYDGPSLWRQLPQEASGHSLGVSRTAQ